MSLKSRIYIGIIAFSLAVIVAVLAARRIQSVWFASDKSQAQAVEENENYYPFADEFAKSPEDSPAPPSRMLIAGEGEEAYVPEKPMQKPFFGGQIDLPALAREQEAYANSGEAKRASVEREEFKKGAEAKIDFERVSEDPVLKQFMADMQNAMGEDAFNGSLSAEEMMEKILNNPQMQKILLQYSKNPKLMQMAEESFKRAQPSANKAAAKSK